MNGPQTRVEPLGRAHPDDKSKPILPGLPGGPPLLPADRTVEEGHEGELVIFDDSDVRQALQQFDQAVGMIYGSDDPRKTEQRRLQAMQTVMMFTLQLAAINLDVKPTSLVAE